MTWKLTNILALGPSPCVIFPATGFFPRSSFFDGSPGPGGHLVTETYGDHPKAGIRKGMDFTSIATDGFFDSQVFNRNIQKHIRWIFNSRKQPAVGVPENDIK